MSEPNNPGPSQGVVRNSAVSFLAPAQGAEPPSDNVPENAENNSNDPPERPQVPAGLQALCAACTRLYPDQPNPLQVTTRLKYWLGGCDPLDYISMYWNRGDPEQDVPAHWHYVSFGLSDLHGDGRVHPRPRAAPAPAPAAPSGYGMELSLRLLARGGPPPLWPGALMQAVARYVFTTGNRLHPGDHMSWHAALDGGGSRLRHLLVAEDPALRAAATPHGLVAYRQLVGCTRRELRAAQRESGFEVLRRISADKKCNAGPLLVTDPARRSARPRAPAPAAPAPAPAPAVLAGVQASVAWTEIRSPDAPPTASGPAPRSPRLAARDPAESEGHMSTDSFEMSSIERALPQIPETMQDSWRDDEELVYPRGVHVMLNHEAARLLPLAIDQRVLFDRHFTWRGAAAVTVLGPGVRDAFASAARPYAARGGWLQIHIPKDFAREISKKVAFLAADSSDSDSDADGKQPPLPLPVTLQWPARGLLITVVDEAS